MAVGGIINKWTPPRKARGIPGVRTRFSLMRHVENEQADAGRDGQTCLARPNSQARTGAEKHIFHVQLTMSRVGNLTRLTDSLVYSSLYKKSSTLSDALSEGNVRNITGI